MEIIARNVNDALINALWRLKHSNVREETRNGSVLRFPEPVIVTYKQPKERVLFWKTRAANPIFHLMESLWILAGRRDVKFIETFNSRINRFSDNGIAFNAAYGHRLRHQFGFDQLSRAIEILRTDPQTRRLVLQISLPRDLLHMDILDHACNTQIMFDVTADRNLNMTVINRSNDMWWGCFGANAVHFSIIHEFIATGANLEVGRYHQFSNNMHLYGKEVYGMEPADAFLDDPSVFDFYSNGRVLKTISLCKDVAPMQFLREVETFCAAPFEPLRYNSRFLREVAFPMAQSFIKRKENAKDARDSIASISADDWRIATINWFEYLDWRKINLASESK
jgi:thymidylate synthase